MTPKEKFVDKLKLIGMIALFLAIPLLAMIFGDGPPTYGDDSGCGSAYRC
jgi:hypothetical protein